MANEAPGNHSGSYSEPTLFDVPEIESNPEYSSDNELTGTHPSVIFDTVAMQKPTDAGVLAGKHLIDPATIPELMPPIDKTIIPPPEHRDDKHKRAKQNKIKGIVLGAVGLVGATVLATTLLLGGGKSDEKAPSRDPVEEGGDSGDAPMETTIVPTARDTNETDGTVAATSNIDLLHIPTGANYITATRLNGEKIKVPYLSGDTPKELANSALALLACFLTTGNQECLENFTSNDAAQAGLNQWRERDILPMLSIPKNKDFQIAMFDNPEDPVVFSSRQDDYGREVVEIQSGTLYFGRVLNNFGSNEWQHPDIREFGSLESTMRSMKLFIMQLEDYKPTVVRFDFDMQPTEG